MKGLDHVRGYFRRLAYRGFVLACSVGLGLIPTFGAQAAVVEGTITGFVPNPFGGGGNYVRANDVRFVLQRAIVKYEASAIGRAVVGEAALTLAPSVGRVIAGACFSNPLGIAACTGAAAAAWFALSRIHWDATQWDVDEDAYGPCYFTKYPGNASVNMPCAGSISSAVSQYTNTANAINYQDLHFSDSDVEATFTTLSVPASIAVNGQAGAHVNRKDVRTYHNGAPSTTTNTDVTVSVFRLSDQMSTVMRPATAGDMASHGGNFPPPDDVVNDYGASGGSVPTLSPDFSKGVGTAGDPYPGDATPNEGPWKQDRVTTVGKPDTTDPMDLDTGTDTVNVDNPNTPEDEGEGDPDDPDTKGDEQTDALDICKEHPEISACQPLGPPPTDEVPKSTVDVQFQSEDLGLPSACPAPIPMGSHGQLTFDVACDVATKISPLVVALGALVALMIMHAAIRRA